MQTLKVAAIQNKPEFGNIRANLHDLIGLLPPECDLAVLPELCATGYQFRDRDELRSMAEIIVPGQEPGPITSRLTDVASASGTTIIAGVAELLPDGLENGSENQPEKIYNSSVLIRSRELQSDSLPGRPPESSAPLRCTSSRALRAASRARFAVTPLSMMARALLGCSSRNVEIPSPTTCSTYP